MEFDPIVFGITIGRIIETYGAAVRVWASPLFHAGFLVMLYLISSKGDRFRKAYTLYFLINYVWLLGAIGIYASIQLFQQAGPVYFGVYSATPVFLVVILLLLIGEWRNSRNHFDFQQVPKWRWAVAVPMMLWGFYYPNWRFDGSGFDWSLSQFVSGNFGLMGCPVTMLALSILFLVYPRVNRHLFQVLTMYGVMLGGAMVAVGYKTDIPFFAMGIISLLLILVTTISARWKAQVRPRPKLSAR